MFESNLVLSAIFNGKISQRVLDRLGELFDKKTMEIMIKGTSDSE